MSDILKVGVIGVGGIAKTHMPGWAASELAEVVAGSDVVAPILETWGEQYGVTKLSTHAAEIINDPDIDIIDVCTPNMYHTELAIAAMEAGKDVICEKPLAPTPADIKRSRWEDRCNAGHWDPTTTPSAPQTHNQAPVFLCSF